MTPFAQRLFLLRNDRGVTRREMADYLCTHIKTYQNWEYGNAEPSFQHLIAISEKLDCTIDYLIKGDSLPANPTKTTQNEQNQSPPSPKSVP